MKNATNMYNWMMSTGKLLSFCLFYTVLYMSSATVAGSGKEQGSKVWKVSFGDVAIR